MHFLVKATKLQLVIVSLIFGLLAVSLVVGTNLLGPTKDVANIQRSEITTPQAHRAGGVFASLGDEAMAEMVVVFADKVETVPSARIVGEDAVDVSSNEQPDVARKPEVLGKKISRVDQIKQMTVGQLVKRFKKDKYTYRGLEPAVFRLETELTVAELLERVSVSDVSANPVDVGLSVTEEGVEKVITITPKKSFHPGQYTLSIDLSFGRFIKQDFTWGVLALNTNKSIYLPNDTGDISIAVLDDSGEMVCDAAVALTITNPQGHKTFLSTQNKKITVQDVCHSKKLTVEPDYKAEYVFNSVGTYLLQLVATTANGTRTMTDYVEVRSSVPFDVSRVEATRIYPLNTYPVEITVTANQDFSGTIVETIPQRYVPSVGPGGTIAYDNTQSTLEGLELFWDVSLTKGEMIVLGYSYDAPDISPQFYLTGPLRFVEGGTDIFSEARLWQIAVDAVGGIGVWRDSAGGQIPGTTWGAMNFATQQRNDGDYTFTGGNTLELDVTGRYLLIATVYFTNATNGRVNYEGRFNYSGTGHFVSVWGSGYSRNSSNNDAWVRVIGLVDGNAVNDTVQLEIRRDTDTPTQGSVADASHFQVIRLPDNTAYGMYTDTSDTGAYGTTSWADVPYNNVVNESDTSIIQKQAGDTDIRLKKDATNFLVAYGMAFGTGGSRTQRVTKMVAGTADIENSFSYAYLRKTSDEYADPNGMFIYRNSGTSTDLSVQAQRGHADNAGSAVRRTSSSGMFVVELPSYAEVLISHDSTGLQDVSGAGGDFNLMRDVTYNNSSSFTKVSNTTMNIEQDMDALLMAQVYIDRPAGGTNSRVTTGAKFTINGVAQSLGYHGNYLRGDQSTSDTYNMAVYPAGVYTVNSGDDVLLQWFDLGNAGAVDTTVANAVGWSALNLTSLTQPMVSGTVYQGDESTAYNCSTDNLTIKVSLNGAVADVGTCTAADGTFDVVMTTAPAPGDIITTYIDSAEIPQAINVHSSAGDRQTTGIDLYENTVIVLHKDAGPITNTDLNTGDNGDAGIRYAVSAGNLTVESGYELHVWTGDTFTPGGNVTTQGTNGHLHIDDSGVFTGETTQDHVISGDVLIDAGATLTAPSTEDNGTIRIGGSFTNNATGVFTSGSGRLIFTATSGNEAVDLQSDSLYDVTFGETSGTATWKLSSALDVNGDLTIDYGTLDMNGSNSINLAGALTINSNGNYTKGSGTFTFDGSGTSTWTNAATIDDMGTVVIDGTSKTVNLASSVRATQVTVTDTLGLGSNGYELTLTGSGAGASRPFIVTGTLTEGTDSKVTYQGTGATEIESETYHDLQFSPASGFPTYTLLAGTLDVDGDFTVGDGSNAVTIDWETNDPTINLAGNFTLSNNSTWNKSSTATLTFDGTTSPVTWTDNNATKQDMGLVTIDGPKVVDIASSITATKIDVTAGDTLNLQSSGFVLTLMGSGTGASRPFIVTGTLTEGTDSKVAYQGTGATEIESETYHDLQFSPASGSPTYTLGTAGSQTITVDGSVTIGDGVNAVTVTAETYDPTLDFNESITIAAAGVFQASSTGTFTIANDFTNNGTFTANSGTVEFDDAGQTSTLLYGATTTFYGLKVSTAGKAVEFDNADQTNIAAGGSLTIQGTSCSSQDVYVNSDTGAAQFEINVDGTATVNIDYADIQYMNATGMAITADQSNDSSNNTNVTFANSCLPEKVVFTNVSRTFTAGACNGVAGVFTMELQNNEGTARTPSSDTVIRVTSDSPEYTIYTDDLCSNPINPGDFTYTSSDTAKSVYIIDTRKSNLTWTLTGTKQSGPETIAAGNQAYTVNADSVSSLLITLPGETFIDGVGNTGTFDLNGGQAGNAAQAGLSFNLLSISAVDSFNNVNENYSGSKNLTWSSGVNYPGDAPDMTPPSYPSSATFTNGQSISPGSVTLYDGTLDDSDTTVAIAVDDSDDPGDFSLDSTEFSVEAAVLQNYLVSVTTPQTSGVCFTGTNTITARDSYNNVRTTDASTVNMSDDGTSVTYYDAGDCLTPTTQYTMSGGTTTMYIKTPIKQTFTITATKDGGIESGSSGPVEVYPGPANTILVRLPGQSFVDGTGVIGSPSFTGLRSPDATAGVAFTIDLKAVDANTNLVDSGPNVYTGNQTISFADSVAGNGPDTTSPEFPSSPVSFTNGEANGLLVTYYLSASGRTVEADDTGTPVFGTASSTFEVKPGAVQNYNVVPDAYTQEAGVAFNVTVTARDDWENQLGALYTAPAGTYTWSTSANDAPDNTSPLLGALVQSDFTSGVATKSVTLYKAESGVTFTATEPAPSTVTGTSTVLTVGPGEVSADTNDSQVTASSTGSLDAVIPITITLKDTWRNPVANVPGADIVLSATASNLPTQPALATDANGQTTGYIRWYTSGVKTVEVMVQNTSLVQDDGVTPDTDGKLDDTHDITINVETEIRIEGGANLGGGMTIIQ